MEVSTVNDSTMALLVLNLYLCRSTSHGERVAVKVIALDGHLRH